MKGLLLYGIVSFVLLYIYFHSKSGKQWWNDLDTQTQQFFKMVIGSAIVAFVLGLFSFFFFPM